MGLPSAIAERFLSRRERRRLRELALKDEGHGYDVFGANAEWVAMGAALMRPLYEVWFRVESHGAENIPKEGGAVLASNHSGTLPFDAAMIWTDVLRRTDPPRIVRPVLDYFVPLLPFFGMLFTRAGSIGGSRGNVRASLEAGELLLVFPEGVVGIGKHFRDRYQLQEWRVGHVELAIRHRVPVVPTAVVGAEEQMPQLARIEIGARLFGAPYLPVPLTLVPLPVRYHIYYGEPMHLSERFSVEDANRPEALEEAAQLVKERVQALIDRGLAERSGVFT